MKGHSKDQTFRHGLWQGERRPFASAIGVILSLIAAAHSSESRAASDEWKFGLSIYGYLPSLDGTSSAPADSNGTTIDITAEDILNALDFTAMGAFEAHNGSWGVFTDFIYLDLGGSKHQSREFEIGGATPPVGTTADLDWDLKGTIWTLAGEYRVVTDPTWTIDLLAGARQFKLKTAAHWDITGDLGILLPTGRTGSSDSSETMLDGIVGIRGRAKFGASHEWAVPFHLDVGAGDADLTWQVATGISYAFGWGDISAQWRYLAYEMKPNRSLKDLSFNGPLIGAAWRW